MCRPRTGGRANVTASVPAGTTDAFPAELRAVTATRRVDPTSASTGAYCAFVAWRIVLHDAPVASQRRQVYANRIGTAPFHVPGVATSSLPTRGVPVIVGTVRFDGRREVVLGRFAGSVGKVWFENAVVDPAMFVPVTYTRSVTPSSFGVSVYAADVAPGIGMHVSIVPAGLQRRHW